MPLSMTLKRQLSSLSANAVMKNSIGLQRCSMMSWIRPEASSFWTLFAKGYSLSKTLNGRNPLLRISAQQPNTSTTKTSEEAGIPSLLPFYFSRPSVFFRDRCFFISCTRLKSSLLMMAGLFCINGFTRALFSER